MTIFRKAHLEPRLKELESFYQRLREAVHGEPPLASQSPQYCGEDMEQFQREYTDVDLSKVEVAIAHFKVEVDTLRKIKTLASKPMAGSI
jgi:hypothetical protein